MDDLDDFFVFYLNCHRIYYAIRCPICGLFTRYNEIPHIPPERIYNQVCYTCKHPEIRG